PGGVPIGGATTGEPWRRGRGGRRCAEGAAAAGVPRTGRPGGARAGRGSRRGCQGGGTVGPRGGGGDSVCVPRLAQARGAGGPAGETAGASGGVGDREGPGFDRGGGGTVLAEKTLS